MNTPTLYVSSDQYLWLLGLTNVSTGAFVTDATVSVQLTDPLNGNANVGSAVSLTYQSGSQTVNGVAYAGGNYRGLLAHSVALVAGQNYIATVTATSGTSQLVKVVTLGAEYDGLT